MRRRLLRSVESSMPWFEDKSVEISPEYLLFCLSFTRSNLKDSSLSQPLLSLYYSSLTDRDSIYFANHLIAFLPITHNDLH